MGHVVVVIFKLIPRSVLKAFCSVCHTVQHIMAGSVMPEHKVVHPRYHFNRHELIRQDDSP